MTDEDRLRRALDYEIEPWTPDPAALISGGRRMAWARRGAVAAAALAVAGTMTGVAIAVNGVSASQPPVIDQPSPSITKPTVPPAPLPPSSCAYYLEPRVPRVVPTVPPSRPVRKPRVFPPRDHMTKPQAIPSARRCRILYVGPTAPVPTSVPAGK